MVEFALVAPIFFLLLFAIIQLGLLFGAQNGLVNAVRDTTRRAATYRVNEVSLDPNTGGVFNSVCQMVGGNLDNNSELVLRLGREIPGFVTANVLNPPGTLPDGSAIPPLVGYEWKSNNDTPPTYFVVAHVTVYYRHPLYVPLVNFFIDGVDGVQDGRLMLSASEQMRVENPDVVVQGTNRDCP